MPGANRTIIAGTLIIMASGAYHYFVNGGAKSNTTLTRIIVGGYMLGLIASLFDLIGLGVGQVAGWILMLAMGVAIFTVLTDLGPRLAKKQGA